MPTSDPQARPTFRADINGLRAWAVALVLLFHFGVRGFGGGFVGVDVFFVISGYLMTDIVLRALGRNEPMRQLLTAFYLARARRILPALLVLCALLMVAGWWLLIAQDYRALGEHALLSATFLSNIGFWREVGYFNPAAHEKWLLHTWSLSLEWQFYLLLPLLLLGLWRLRPARRTLLAAVFVAALLSLALNLLLTPHSPMASFYLLPTRAWELLAGSLVCLLGAPGPRSPRARVWLQTAGMLLILGAAMGLDASSPWPGWRALLPVAGAVAVLCAAHAGHGWTGHGLAQWLGTRSYSVYLWHWPITVALAQVGLGQQGWAIAAGLALSLVLGHLSFALVEGPARRWCERQRPARLTVAAIAGITAIVLPAAVLVRLDGVAQRLPAEVNQLAAEANNRNPRRDSCLARGAMKIPDCVYGGPRVRAIVLGDSHADAMVTAVAAALPGRDDGVLSLTYVGCPTLLGVKSGVRRDDGPWRCAAFLDHALQRLKTYPPDLPLIVINRTSGYLRGNLRPGQPQPDRPTVYFSRPHATTDAEFIAEYTAHLVDTSCQLAAGRPVYLVRPVPEMDRHVPRHMAYARLHGQPGEIGQPLRDYHARHGLAWAAQDAARARCGVHILDPLPLLCPDGECQASWLGRPLYVDDDHLSEYGNRRLVPMFAEVFRPAGSASAPAH